MPEPPISTDGRVETGPTYVITVIHGKFSPKAKWAQKGAPFRESLIKRFGSEVLVRRRVWRSKKEEDPAGRLSRFVKKYADRFPDAQQILVCRSHRGTAALYAMRDQFLRSRVAGIACLEWPFAVTHERSIRRPLSIGAWFAELFIVTSAILSCAIGATLLRALWGQAGVGPISLKVVAWLLIVASLAVMAWYFFVMRPLRISRTLHAKVLPIIERWQKAAMARLAIPAKLEIPILWQAECSGSSPVQDEASSRIWIAQLFLRNLEVSPGILYAWEAFASLAMLLGGVVLFVRLFENEPRGLSGLNGIWFIYSWPLWTGLAILLWAGRIWLFNFLVFGETDPRDIFVVKTAFEYSMDGPGVLEKNGLVSSSRNICSNSDFGDWMAGLPKRQLADDSDAGRSVTTRS